MNLKKKTRKQLIKELDKVYSKYVRNKYAKNGMVECYTCGVIKPIKEMDCGHYISRRVMSTRWFEKNTKPQCRACNRFQEGNKPKFALHLKAEYGSGILEELDQISRILVKPTNDKLMAMIDYYKRELKKNG